MKEKPILFSGPMVRAILDGEKTQTRRLVKLPPDFDRVRMADGGEATRGCAIACRVDPGGDEVDGTVINPLCAVGDTLWVKETWRTLQNDDAVRPRDLSRDAIVRYDATDDARCIWNRAGERVESWFNRGVTAQRDSESPWEKLPWGRTRVSIHMPRWASRLSLRVTDVRVERLGDISDADCKAEGAMHWWASFSPDAWEESWGRRRGPRYAFERLWESVHGPEAWENDACRWVWVYTFEVDRG